MTTSFDPSIEESRSSARGLLMMRVLYFLFFAGVGAYWSFINVYYNSIGLSGTQIGLINTLGPLVGIFAAILWNVVNDRLGNPRLLLMIAAPGTAAMALLVSTAHSFGTILLFASMQALFNSAIIPMMDNTTLRLLGERRGQYGQYRVAGSFGFIITALVVGGFYGHYGLATLFPIYAAMMVIYALASSFLPKTTIRLPGSLWGGVSQMIRQPAWLLFAVSATLLWISNNGTMNFIGVTVKTMNGSDFLVGLVWMMSAVAEIPIMISGERLLRRVGHTRLLTAAFITFTLRGILLAVMPTPEWAALISLLGGLSFAMFWTSAVVYANEAAPEHLKSTAQGLLFSILNIANMGGALSSGWLFDAAGFRGLFWAMAGFSFAGLVVFTAGRLFFQRRASAA